MLVLTRKVGESLQVGDDVVVTLVKIAGDKVRIGISAPCGRLILRTELKDKKPNEKDSPDNG